MTVEFAVGDGRSRTSEAGVVLLPSFLPFFPPCLLSFFLSSCACVLNLARKDKLGTLRKVLKERVWEWVGLYNHV